MTTTKQGAGFRIRTEALIVLIFFFFFIIWGISKCRSRSKAPAFDEETAKAIADSTAMDSLNNLSADFPKSDSLLATLQGGTLQGGVPQSEPIIQTVYATKLYVSIEGLKLRRGPSIDSPFITRLPLFDELVFLNEVSDSTDIISLSETIIANEPWVRVRSSKGQEGWVYGAGVHYYKLKYPGM
jgi:Bacterial SH3 domain